MAPTRSCALALLFLAGISLTLAATVPTPVITNVVPGNQRVTIYFNRIPDQSPPLQQMAVNCLDTRITVDPKNVDQQIAIDSSATSVLVTGLANNIYYTCTLRARAWQANTLLAPVSQSNVSAASTAFMPTGTTAPVGLSVQPGDSDNSVVLTWSSPTYSLSPITYYIVACVPNATDSTATAPASRVIPVTAGVMNATVTGLTANTLYTCGVQSRGQSSASASAQSNVVTGTSSSPAITGSVVRADSVTLSFAAPTNANAGPVAHYKAACVPSSSVLAYSGDSNSDANGNLPANSTSATISDLAPGEYSCRVTAVFESGEEHTGSTDIVIKGAPVVASPSPTVDSASVSPSPAPRSSAAKLSGYGATFALAMLSALLLTL
ncbi:hypothetical protein QBZ16_000734 [Prototheca wickerhamii]|uniref:Fibronectin type-III domain-containing protein n=1 Tax=Prototheca wickerhamii TaxID=3111 RepID=A0AAD9MMA6_PROWI|nr:hypothetical protein QBZ16_000734 [Prototheca wickerhamii]